MEWGSEGQLAPHLALIACYLSDSGDLWDKLGPFTPETHTPGSGTRRATAAASQRGEPERSDGVRAVSTSAVLDLHFTCAFQILHTFLVWPSLTQDPTGTKILGSVTTLTQHEAATTVRIHSRFSLILLFSSSMI